MLKIEDDRININRGESGAFSIEITDENNVPYTMEEGDKLIFTVRKFADSVSPVLLQTVSYNNIVVLNHEDTAKIVVGKYSCDANLIRANGEPIKVYPQRYFGDTKVCWGNFIVSGEVTTNAES